MKLSVLQENLAAALSIANRAVTTKGILPVLANILLRADGSRVTLESTNLEIGIIHTCPAKVDAPGAIALPARQLTDYVNALPPDRIDLELNPKTQTLHLKCARYEANIKGMDESEFPIIPTFEKQDHALIEPDLLKGLITRALISAAQDASLPVLKSVLCEFTNLAVKFVAVDRFRLTVACSNLERAFKKSPPPALIPASALREIAKLLSNVAEPVSIAFSQNLAQGLFVFGDTLFVANLTDADGNFPDHTQIVPKSHSTRAVCNTHELTQSVKAAMVFARDTHNNVRLTFQRDDGMPNGAHLTIVGQNAETGDAANSVECYLDGDNIEIAFNGKYLLDFLAVINAPQIAFELTNAAAPGVLKPVASEDFIHVILPMHITERRKLI